MTRKEQISGYVSTDEKKSIKSHAAANDMSVSQWVTQACREKIERETLADDAQRYRVEQRLLALVDDASDRAADQITEQVLDALADQGAIDDGQYEWGEQ